MNAPALAATAQPTLRNALDGLTVIDFTQIGAGPTCTMLLADMGARVIKVEPPGGELGRGLGPAWIGDDSALFHGFNRNKLGVALDLKSADGVAVARRLVATADIVVESMRPGVMARLGLDHAQLAADHPRLIYCSISAYGQHGPYAQRAGVDGILQADAGLMSLTGTPDGEPCKVQAPVVDVMTGYVASMGVLAKLAQRARDGLGGHLDVSLFNAALALQQSSLTSYGADGQLPQRIGSAAPYSAPNQAFRTADGWIMVAAYMPERWRRLCDVLGQPGLADDPRFATPALRVANRAAMVAALSAAFVKHTTACWLALLHEADILCAPVANYEQVLAHPQLAANRMIQSVQHDTLGEIRMPGFPINSVQENALPARPAPARGQHTEAVLAELGYRHDEIAALAASGAVHCGVPAARKAAPPVTATA
ncbi:carnitine dehydratase [Cupriavidus taiwanensis]|uniref:CaiB/BaiF CoA transferase family protein n=1 Tax=Cupriavidus taiwanensis TaxID=164546 RepID=UPI001F00B91F|nr:CoA transferase [Cupriavidus taiwanensis]ULX51961.1 carnitine dehydratase [Cupriavidus taiwanensis]